MSFDRFAALDEASRLARSPVFADRCRALALARSANRDGQWWMLRSQSGHEVTLLVFSTIADGTLGDFILAADAATVFTVQLDCPGGSTSDALRIGRLLALRGNSTVLAIGDCKSAANFILAGCARRFATSAAAFMLHEITSAVTGNAAELRRRADLLETSTTEAAEWLSAQTGIALATCLAWFSGEEVNFTAAEALAAGLVQEIVPADDNDTAHQRTPHEPPDDTQLGVELAIGLRHLHFADAESVRTWLRPLLAVDT